MSAKSDRWKAACNATAFVNHVSVPSRRSALAASGVGTPPTAVRRGASRDGGSSSGELLERVIKLQQENRVLTARAETAEAAVLDLSREKEVLLVAVSEADAQTQTLVEAAEVDARARSTMQDELEALGKRSERLSQLYKEDLEKSRLRARREGYYRHEEAGITQPEGSLGSISDADRFVTDVAAVNKNERDAAIAKQEQMYYAKRLNNADREP